MADEEDINSIKKNLEDLDAKIDQLEDLQLTNKLNIVELKKELYSIGDLKESSRGVEVSEDAEGVLSEIRKEKEEITDWENNFEEVKERISQFKGRLSENKEKIGNIEGGKVQESTFEGEEREGNICGSCGMKNDPDAKYCVVCGNEL